MFNTRQKGKEKPLSGAAGDRFNNSMVLLAAVTVGTPMEKIRISRSLT
ncbi:MAG: hypothetical protein II474_10945 [Firmicutes bacterium]|nr:hypothetical protein [Bacillota bacterium]